MPTFRFSEYLRINYEIHGEGFPLVMLHGLGGSTDDWALLVSPLSKKYQLVLIDLNGFGKSKNTGNKRDYSIPGLAQEVKALLFHIGLSRFAVIGFSFGGAVAFQLAASKELDTLRITSLVAISSQPSYQLKSSKRKAEYYFRRVLLKIFGIKGLATIIAKRLFPKENQYALMLFAKSGLRSNKTQSYVDAMKALIAWSVEDKLNDITIPVLIVGADRDYKSLDCVGYAHKLPNATVKNVKDCGHAIPLEKPNLLSSAIEEFIPS